jgi:sulfite reductase (NADPH) hemoprotein beta-component
VGNIGILGVDKKGEEFYQISLGGSADDDASIARILGPGLPAEGVTPAVDRIVEVYLRERQGAERFIDTYRRTGAEPFKEAVYAEAV